MLFAVILGVAASLATSAEARQSETVVISDIEMSEFTPPTLLYLDFSTGSYSIVTPTEGWPTNLPSPQSRKGRLSGEKLTSVRKAFDAVLVNGASNQKCVAANGRGYALFAPSNSGVPKMSLSAGGKHLSTSSIYDCWTPAARTLHIMLEQTFDHQNP
jgi:hypothetical protein